jgi:hypothetical protein
MMNYVNGLWSSPWRRLQKNLARGFAIEGRGEARSVRHAQVQGMLVPSNSWLVRARSRKVRVSRVIQ